MTSAIYSFVLLSQTFFMIGQDWYCLLNHCLSTQTRKHVRPCAMPRAVFSFTNNNPFYYKQSILLSEQSILLQNNQSYCKTINPTTDLLL